MSGALLRLELDASPALAALAGVRERLADLSPVMAAIGEAVVSQTMDSFEDQASPAGVPWKPSLRALAEDGQTLVDSGALRSSINYRVGIEVGGGAHVEVGTGLVYGAIHQLGGRAGKGLKVQLPARPYLPDEESLDRAEIAEMVSAYVRGE